MGVSGILQVFVILAFFIYGCSSRTVTSDLCDICAVRSPHPHKPSSFDVCQGLIDVQTIIHEIKLTARAESDRILNTFDFNDQSLRRRSVIISVPSNVSMMAKTYNRIVAVHLYRMFSETSRWSDCFQQPFSRLTRDLWLAACKLGTTMRATAQLRGFDAVCRKQLTFPGNVYDDGCHSFQEQAYNSIQFVLEELEAVSEDIRMFKNEWGC